MTYAAARASIVTEIERAKTAWNAGANGYQLVIDYTNNGNTDLADLQVPYLMVDIVGISGQQLDLGPNPLIQDGGSIILAAGAKEGTGTVKQIALLDFFRPYLELRDGLGLVRTSEARRHVGKLVNGYWYEPMAVNFWTVNLKAPVP